jgi:putative MFS transporter
MVTAHPTPAGPAVIAARMDRLPLSRWHWKLTIVIGIVAIVDVYEIFLGGVLSSILKAPWGLGQNSTATLIAAPFIGMAIGCVLIGRLADRLGRKPLFMTALGAYSLLSIAGAFSTDLTMLVVLRMLCGMFMGAELILLDTYLSETMPKKHRGRMIAVAFAIGFLGTPLVALAGVQLVAKTHLLIEGWRWLMIIGGVGALLILWLRRAMPESPRWLAVHGRLDEADRLVTSIEATVLRETRLEALPVAEPIAATPARKVRLSDMFGRDYRGRTIMLWIFHILQTVGQYGFNALVPIILLAKGFTVVHSLTYTSLTYIGAPVGAALAIPLIERFERKHLIIATALLSAAAGLWFGMTTSNAVIIATGVFITMSNNVFSSSFHVYQTELYPTSIRSSATGIAYALSRLSAAALPYGALAILAAFGANGVFVAAAAIFAVLCVVVGLLGPRTTGKSLEEATLRASAVTETGTRDRNPHASAGVETSTEQARHL